MNFKNPKMPNVPTRGATTTLKVALFGGAAVYAALNSLYNVDGGHRAIVFNRIDGIKDKGEAKSIELIGKAMSSDPSFLALRQIEAAGEISHTIALSSNKVFLTSEDLLLNI